MTPIDAIKYSFNEFLGGGNLNVATVASCQVRAVPAQLLDGRVVETSILNKHLRIQQERLSEDLHKTANKKRVTTI